MKDYMMALHQRFCKEPECREVREQISEVEQDLRQMLDRQGQEQLLKLADLEDELQAFVKNTQWMLDEFFQELPSRKRQDYIRAYARYRDVIEDAMQAKQDVEDEGEEWRIEPWIWTRSPLRFP